MLDETVSSKPLYVQLKDLMIQRIVDGRWPVGEALPNENEIARELSVSIGTVRRAVDELVNQGAIVRRQGKGSFILTHDTHTELCRFFPLASKHGEKAMPSARLMSIDTIPAQDEHMVLFDQQVTQPLIHQLRRLRFFNDRPVMIETICVAESRFKNIRSALEFQQAKELYALYQNYFGLTVISADEAVNASVANEIDASDLEVASGTPLITIDRIARQMDGSAVELRYMRCLASEFTYISRIGAAIALDEVK